MIKKNSSKNKFNLRNILLLTCLLSIQQVIAEEVRYITDMLYVPLRSGAGNEYRIISTTMRSGNKLVVTEGKEGDEWMKVLTENGIEGWVRTQYLSNQPSSRSKLTSALAKIATLEEENKTLNEQYQNLLKNNQELTNKATSESSERKRIDSELQKIKSLSADAINLERRYRELLEGHEMLETEKEALSVENDKLKSDQRLNFMFYGAGLILIGVILTIVVPSLRPKKRYSEWR